jgi:hypothetical protein
MYLLGVFWGWTYINVGNMEFRHVDIELEGDGALDMYEDAFVITYLQTCEVLIKLKPKESDQVVHRVKWFKWKCNSFLQMLMDA